MFNFQHLSLPHTTTEASKRLSLATRWSLLKYTSSEHYHVINYGIGGQIEVHVDYWGPNFTMDSHPGGARTATAIGYASTTLVGGYTIFPGNLDQKMFFFKPKT